MTSRGLDSLQIGACAVLSVVFAAMTIEGLTFRELARWYPLFTGIAGVATCVIGVVAGVALRRRAVKAAAGSKQQPEPADLDAKTSDRQALVAGWRWFVVLVALVVTMRLFGMLIGAILWTMWWFVVIRRWKMRWVLVAAASVGIFLLATERYLNTGLPGGLLF